MSRKKKTPPHGKSDKETPAAVSESKGTLGLKIWQADIIACVLIFLAVFLLFNELILRDMSFSKGDDTETSTGLNSLVYHEIEAGHKYPAWCPNLFGGFPSLAAGAYSNYNLMGPPYSVARRWLSPHHWADLISRYVLFLGAGKGRELITSRWLISLFLYSGLLTYLLMRRLSFRPLIALVPALLMAWNPYMISLATAAHGGKLMTFVYLPLILLLTHQLLEKRRLLDVALLALAFAWQIAWAGHTQVVYYGFIMTGLYWFVWALWNVKVKPLGWVAPAAMIAASILLGFAHGAIWYMPLYEYLPYSIRGTAAAFSAGSTGGYSIEQATMWSFHPKELLTFAVPSWFGLKSPLYWGPMPFTSSSFYFGIVPLLFAVFAFFAPKNRMVVSLGVISAVAFVLSLGRHFEGFYKLLFNYLPFFNKFRTPSLIILLVQLSGIILAGFGIRYIAGLEKSERWRKIFLIGLVASIALFLIVLVGGNALQGAFGSFEKPGEASRVVQHWLSQGVPQAQAQANAAQYLAQLKAERFSLLRTDLLWALTFLALAFAAAFLKLTGKIKRTPFILAILAIAALDIWLFSHKFFSPQPPETAAQMFPRDSAVQYLEQDSSLYRVFPAGRLLQDNSWNYFSIQSLGGYHGVKMRAYQDMLDYLVYKGPDARLPLHLPLLSSLNCKYILTDSELGTTPALKPVIWNPKGRRYLYENLRVLPRAYFVDSVAVIPDRKDALEALRRPNFQPDYWAVVDRELPGPISPTPNRNATVTSYETHEVTVKVETDRPSFMVFSDAHYSPGWKAMVDGKISDIYLVNTFVRGLYLSEGKHHVRFFFRSNTLRAGIGIATTAHFVIWALIGWGWWMSRKSKRKATS